ncbi:hypothetical protein G6514_001929 [Epicoccum nigrum]|nr:hypothetical protein G6514_001929 [Epicoccum nigrum]
MLCHSDLLPFPTEQEAGVSVEELAFPNYQMYDPSFTQDNTGGQLAQASSDPTLSSGSAFDTELAAWGWPDPSGLVYPSALQQDCSSAQMTPSLVADDASPAQMDPAAWAWFDQSGLIHEPTPQQSHLAPAVQCRGCGSEALDRVDELRAMILQLEARTDQRMALVEEAAVKMQRRLVAKTYTP